LRRGEKGISTDRRSDMRQRILLSQVEKEKATDRKATAYLLAYKGK